MGVRGPGISQRTGWVGLLAILVGCAEAEARLADFAPVPEDAPFPVRAPRVDIVQGLAAYLGPDAAEDIDERTLSSPFALPAPDPTRWSATWFLHRNYACARSGQQSFLLLNPPGASWDQSMDLLVYLHGGGIGAFDRNGSYQPQWFLEATCRSMVDEEDAGQLLSRWSGNPCETRWPPRTGLASAVVAAADQRVLLVSKCDQDTYGGEGTVDPYNGWRSDNEVDGLLATLAAIDAVEQLGATDSGRALILAGASAGGVGVFSVSRARRARGQRVDGLVSDGAVMSDAFDTVHARAAEGCAFLEQVAEPRWWRPRLGRVARSSWQPHLHVDSEHPPVFLSYAPGDRTFCDDAGAAAVFEAMAEVVRRENPGGVSEVRATCLEGNRGCDAHALLRWVSPETRNARTQENVLGTITDWINARRR